MALGALYRSRKALIVGEPRQVEPVVTDDLALLKKAYKEDVYKPLGIDKIKDFRYLLCLRTQRYR